MTYLLPTPEGQVQFLRDVQRLLAEGLFTASDQFALLRALADLAVLNGEDSGAPRDVSFLATRSIEEGSMVGFTTGLASTR
jgi:hypothetical protein